MLATIDCPWTRLRIVVLAAGYSSRLGRPKTLARVHGLSLLRRTVRVLAHVTRDRILVVVPPRATRHEAELRGCRVQLLVNTARADGLSTSVVRALRHTRHCSATLFLPADLATLASCDIARLITSWRPRQRCVVARAVAGRASTPLILPKHLYAKALQVAGDIGLRELVAALPARDRRLVDLPSAELDIDTPQDLAAARRRFTTGRG